MRYFIAMTFRLLLAALLSFALASAHAARDGESLVLQAESALAAGDDRAAEKAVSRVRDGSLDPEWLARMQIVRARIGLKRQKPRAALYALPRTSSHVPALAPQIELLRGQAWFMEGQPVYAVRVLTQRERLLGSDDDIERNRTVIWDGLIATPIPASALAELSRESAATRGWIDLALVMQDGPSNAALQRWNNEHPGHPAATRAAGIRLPGGSRPALATAPAGLPDAVSPRGYALLLPLSGPIAGVGRALRDGFISAWFESPPPRAGIRIYDTGGEPGRAVSALQDAINDGAQVIVGPVTRASVAAVARAQTARMPWLALNYVEEASTAVQFGLAPDDEARAAALDAIEQDLRAALVLVPASDWGYRAAAAFTQVFELEGGKVLLVERFPEQTRDLTRPLRNLLGLEHSNRRHRELTQIIGTKSEFEPRARRDAGLLFAPLRAREAHTLMPKLDFLRAAPTTPYMLSAAHRGLSGEHLGGVRLCDMPWIGDARGHWSARRAAAVRDFPDAMRGQPRLFALGLDAHGIARGLLSRSIDLGERDGASGRLRIVGNRVERAVGCRTVPKPAAMTDESALDREPLESP